jgi:hypothetical protein
MSERKLTKKDKNGKGFAATGETKLDKTYSCNPTGGNATTCGDET